MISSKINAMVAGEVVIEDDIFYISEVEISVFQEELRLNGEEAARKDRLYSCFCKHRTLYVSAVISEDGGHTTYCVTDRSLYDAFNEFSNDDEITAYELYDNVTEYRNSSYEAFFNIVSNNVEALGRAYHDRVGTLDELEDEVEEHDA